MVRGGLVSGIGTDIVKQARFERLLTKKSSTYIHRLVKRLLHSEYEHDHFYSLEFKRQARYLGGAWATKEALFKTLKPDEQRRFKFNEWYRIYDINGKPSIGGDNWQKGNDEFHLSISHDGEYIVATVLRQMIF